MDFRFYLQINPSDLNVFVFNDSLLKVELMILQVIFVVFGVFFIYKCLKGFLKNDFAGDENFFFFFHLILMAMFCHFICLIESFISMSTDFLYLPFPEKGFKVAQ